MQSNILIFKTNISTQKDLELVGDQLKKTENITDWNVDLDDCDYVLRIVSPSLEASYLINLIAQLGYTCLELE